jgi:hypothetical protein
MKRAGHYYSPWNRRYFAPYIPYLSNQQQLFQSQNSDVYQSIYNQGYMDGVTQTSVVNQTQNTGWW